MISIYVMVFVMSMDGQISDPYVHDKAFKTHMECNDTAVQMREALKDKEVKYLIGCRKFTDEII